MDSVIASLLIDGADLRWTTFKQTGSVHRWRRGDEGLGLQLLESVRGLLEVPVGSDRGSLTRPGGQRKFLYCDFSASSYRPGGLRSRAPSSQPSSARGGTPLCKTPQIPAHPPRLHGEVYRQASQTPRSEASSGLHPPWAQSANLALIRLPLFPFRHGSGMFTRTYS